MSYSGSPPRGIAILVPRGKMDTNNSSTLYSKGSITSQFLGNSKYSYTNQFVNSGSRVTSDYDCQIPTHCTKRRKKRGRKNLIITRGEYISGVEFCYYFFFFTFQMSETEMLLSERVILSS